MKLKDEIERYLKTKKLNRLQLAKRAGITPSILYLYLNGKRGMTLKSVEKIQDAMHGMVNPKDLLS